MDIAKEVQNLENYANIQVIFLAIASLCLELQSNDESLLYFDKKNNHYVVVILSMSYCTLISS